MSVAPLGKPVVPDVYWMLIGVVELQPGLALGELLVADALAGGQELLPVVLEHDRLAQLAGSSPRTSASMPT